LVFYICYFYLRLFSPFSLSIPSVFIFLMFLLVTFFYNEKGSHFFLLFVSLGRPVGSHYSVRILRLAEQ